MTTSLIRYVTAEGYFDDLRFIADTVKRNEEGEPMPAERFPKELYGKYTGGKVRKLPDLCNAGGFWVVSAPLAEVLGRFDLGQGSLYPVEVFQIDRRTPVEGEYYCINFGNRKASFQADQSPRAQRIYPEQDLWELDLAPEDDDIALSEAALQGPDIWVEAPRFRSAFFISDRLVQALRDAKLTRWLCLYRCRIIKDPAA